MWGSFMRMAPLCLVVGATAVGRGGGQGSRPATPRAAAPDPVAGGGPPAAYRGAHLREVRWLLDHAAGWRTSRDARTDGGVPPPVPIACVRDAYVAAAVQHAWAAESYYRLRHPGAAAMAAAARADLDNADELCAATRRGGTAQCETLDLWGCPAPL